MRDIDKEANKTLSALPYTVVYQHPEKFNALPVVSFYMLTENNSFASDNVADVQCGYVVVDVWTNKPVQCGTIALEVNEAMEADGWTREFSRDMPPEEGIYHKTMRYSREFTI